MNLSAMTPAELVQHAEIFATTELERCLLAAITKIRDDVEQEVTEAQRAISDAAELEDDLNDALNDALDDLHRAEQMLRGIAAGDEAAMAKFRLLYAPTNPAFATQEAAATAEVAPCE